MPGDEAEAAAAAGIGIVPEREHFGVSFGKDSGGRDSTGDE